MLALALATGVGMVVLWPGEVEAKLSGSLARDSYKAEVESVQPVPCPALSTGGCQLATVRLKQRPELR